VKIYSEHVARVLDVGTTESGTPYMVMEYLDGDDLAQVLATRGALPVEETVGFVLEACEAIAEAHSLGIVHRDLKPANLFLARRPSGKPIVKVLDFGISKVPAGGKEAATTSANALMGSPVYMSPEQMVAPNSVDVRTDVWCLGVVLYEMLSQKLPFEGETMPELVFTVVDRPHRPLRSVRPDVPEALGAVVDRCLEKSQAQRFANVAELARALAPFASARSEQSVERVEYLLGKTDSVPRQMAPAPVVAPRPDGQTFLPTTSQTAAPGHRLLVVPLGLTLVAVAVGAFFVLRPPRRAAVIPGPSAVAVVPVAQSASATAAPSEMPSSVLLAPPSAESPSAAAPGPSSTAPWWAGKADPHAHGSRHPAASAPTPIAAPACHIVTSFDADGNKHFKQVCP
jgi:eukaryotic-like serine/threonine-protein kinase